MNVGTPIKASADRRHLLAFAAAQALHQTGSDPLITIVHLFFPIAEDLDGQTFNSEKLSQELDLRYGLSVSTDLAKHWVTELAKHGALKRIDREKSSDTYAWSKLNAEKNETVEKFDDFFDKTVSAFVQFAHDTNDIFFHNFDEDDATKILYELLIHETIINSDESEPEKKYIFSKFISELEKLSPELVEFLATLRSSAILTDLLLHINVPRVADGELRGLSVYFDGPLAMDTLGLGGKKSQQYLNRLLGLVAESGAKAYLPSHYVDEIRYALRKLLDAEPHERRGPTAKAIREGEIDTQRIAFIRDNLEAILEQNEIAIDKSFVRHIENSSVSTDQESILFSKLNTEYENQTALNRDIDTYKGMVGRRSTRRSHSIRKVQSIFVTRNSLLSATVNYHMRVEHSYSERDIPIFLSCSKFTALICAMYGIEKTRDIPVRELLSATSRSLEFKPEILAKIQLYLERQKDEDRHEILELLQSADYSSIALDAALGTERNLNEEQTAKVVDRLRERIKAESREELIEEKKRSAREISETKTEARLQIERARSKAAERQRARISSVMRRYRKYQNKRECSEQAGRILRICGPIIIGLLSLMISGLFEVNPSIKVLISVGLAVATGIPSPLHQKLIGWFEGLIERPLRKELLESSSELGFRLVGTRKLDLKDLRIAIGVARQERRLELPNLQQDTLL